MPGILIVDSIDDEITRRRHALLASSPRTAGYQITYAYALDPDEDDQDMHYLDILARNPPTKDGLYGRIKTSIERYKPDYVLLHTGFVFRRHPELFYEVFRMLRAEFGAIGFGFQERDDMIVDSTAFTAREDVRSIQSLFFHDILGL